MTAAILTFDLGTTALKTALIDEGGNLLAIDTREYALLTPQPNRVEMLPDSYWQAACAGTRAVLAKTGIAADAVQAIGMSSQGQTFIPLDPAGTPLGNAIVWLDNRAQAIADAWEADWLTRDDYARISGYPFIPAGLTVFKIAWLAQHAPEMHRAWKFLCLPDYLLYLLTGETATDYVTARMAGLFDLQTGDWEPRLLAAAGITAAQLPTVLPPGHCAGQLRAHAAAALGLPAGIPVCVGANDQLAGAVGAGNIAPGIATETTGTALALIATTPALLTHDHIAVGRHALPNLYYAMTYHDISAIILKWFRDLCAPNEPYDRFLADIDQVPPGSDGLVVLPHFAGMTVPRFDPTARGAFIGLTLGHTRAHLARAIMESCACLLLDCLQPIAEQESIHVIRSLGGAARNLAWLQMKADLLGIPVERPRCADAASLGAAMLAATGIGWFTDAAQASTAWYRPDRAFTPDPARTEVYRQVYARYHELSERLQGFVPVMG